MAEEREHGQLIYLSSPQQIEYRDYELPEPEPGGLLAKIIRANVCGSELHIWRGHHPTVKQCVMGHEMVGRVHRLGEGVENFPEIQVPKATGWVKGTAIEFNGNKVTVTVPAETPRSGTFKVSRIEGDKVIVAFARDEGGTAESGFKMVTENTMRWDIGQGREIILVKARN